MKSIWGKFIWGAATSSHQIEGYNRHNDWWAWEAQGKVEGGVRSGPATDHLNRFREDLRLAKELGLNSYRFSFEWSRFEPVEGSWDLDACSWYDDVLTECERLGLLPMATLHHFTCPQWLAEQGGFTNPEAPEKFAAFVRRIAQRFGPRIPLWCTLNEPMVLVSGAYIARFMPPAVFKPRAASEACFGLLKAHVLAYDILKNEITTRTGPFADHPLMVGFAHNMMHFAPERRYHPIDYALARLCSFLHNDAWLEAVNGEKQRFGYPGFLPFSPEVPAARGRRTFDFIGINYYTKAYIQWRPRRLPQDVSPELQIGLSFARRGATASDLGWKIHPRGFQLMLRKLLRFGVPIYVTENGIADAEDRHRAGYIRSHLAVVASAIAEGLDIRGYYHWSLLDNFEWIKGFWPRFGLYSVDYSDFRRTPRASAAFYRRVIEAHGGSGVPCAKILDGVSAETD